MKKDNSNLFDNIDSPVPTEEPIKENPDKNKKSAPPALHMAIMDKDIERVEALLNDGTDVNSIDDTGNTALHCAILTGSSPIVEILIREGANLNAMGTAFDTPLQMALRCANVEMEDSMNIIKTLIEAESDLTAEDFANKQTALHMACEYKYPEVVKLLLSKGADINARDGLDNAPLHLAIENDSMDIVEILVAHKADLNNGDMSGNTPLHKAVEKQSAQIIKYLVAKGSNIDMGNEFDETPLLTAIKGKSTEIAKLLIELGANVNLGKYDGTPLSVAEENKMDQIVELLKQKGAIEERTGTPENSLDIESLQNMMPCVKAYARMINNMDPSIIEPYLTDDVTYHAEWAIEEVSINSKEKCMNYISNRIYDNKYRCNTTHPYYKESTTYLWNLFAEIGIMDSDPCEPQEPCVILSIGDKTSIINIIRFKVEKDKIKSIQVIALPLYNVPENHCVSWVERGNMNLSYSVDRTGEYPK